MTSSKRSKDWSTDMEIAFFYSRISGNLERCKLYLKGLENRHKWKKLDYLKIKYHVVNEIKRLDNNRI